MTIFFRINILLKTTKQAQSFPGYSFVFKFKQQLNTTCRATYNLSRAVVRLIFVDFREANSLKFVISMFSIDDQGAVQPIVFFLRYW
ncbi:MAG: hypothetical protein ABIN94_06300 [Ferruginibacter sp.]